MSHMQLCLAQDAIALNSSSPPAWRFAGWKPVSPIGRLFEHKCVSSAHRGSAVYHARGVKRRQTYSVHWHSAPGASIHVHGGMGVLCDQVAERRPKISEEGGASHDMSRRAQLTRLRRTQRRDGWACEIETQLVATLGIHAALCRIGVARRRVVHAMALRVGITPWSRQRVLH